MDPEQTLRACEAHLKDGNLREAAEALAAYWAWRGHGGFSPPGGDRRARELAQRLIATKADDGPDAPSGLTAKGSGK
jgi:hypothetical protein